MGAGRTQQLKLHYLAVNQPLIARKIVDKREKCIKKKKKYSHCYFFPLKLLNWMKSQLEMEL